MPMNLRLFSSLREQRCGQITVARIRKQNDNILARVLRTLCQLNRRKDRRAGRNADQNALAASNLASGRKRILVLDRNHFVVYLRVQYIRNKACLLYTSDAADE